MKSRSELCTRLASAASASSTEVPKWIAVVTTSNSSETGGGAFWAITSIAWPSE